MTDSTSCASPYPATAGRAAVQNGTWVHLPVQARLVSPHVHLNKSSNAHGRQAWVRVDEARRCELQLTYTVQQDIIQQV